jgi:hypothetical protein
MKIVVALSLALASSLALAHQHGDHTSGAVAPVSTTVKASSCWIRAIPAPAPSGGFFVLENSGPKPVRLTSVKSPSYGMVMMHQTTQSNGMSRMSEVPDIQVPAGGSVQFKPGGYHLMLEKAADSVKVGASVYLQLMLDDGSMVPVRCDVKPPNAMPEAGMGGHVMGH